MLCAALLLSAIILYRLDDGFPPWAWRFSLEVFPKLPNLWAVRGLTVLLPLVGLLLLSFLLLVLWSTLFVALGSVTLDWWHHFKGRQSFSQDLREAEELAEQIVQRTAEVERRTHSARTVVQVQRDRKGRSYDMGSAAPAFMVERSPDMEMVGAKLCALPVVDITEASPCASPDMEMVGAKLCALPIVDIEQCDTLPVGKRIPAEVEEEQTLELQAVQGSTLQLLVGVETDTGIARKNAPNEDNVLALQGTRPFAGELHPVGLFAVADGMGGHAHGQEASQLAVQAIHDAIVPTLQRAGEENEDELFADLLKEGVHRANLAIYQRNRDSQEQQGKMGTTITAALVVNTQAYIVNVGDSRTYHYRQGEGLRQLTQDHSVVARLVEHGVITRDDIYTHPQRNQIYRCLGDHSSVQADFFKVELQVHDLLLLCSDGLWEMVRDADIEKIISSSRPHATQISTTLIQAALNRGGADNVSVVVIGIEPLD
jgi:serine/threonine protein phosphatase PrpC